MAHRIARARVCQLRSVVAGVVLIVLALPLLSGCSGVSRPAPPALASPRLPQSCTLHDTITEFPVPTPGSHPADIALGPDGNLWFTEYFGAKIGRITPAGTITEYPLSGFADPWGIVAGPDHSMWFADLGSSIGKIDPSTGAVTEYPVSRADAHYGLPNDLIADSNQNLWFLPVEGNFIGKLDPARGTYTFYKLPAGVKDPEDITRGPDGNLWLTDPSGSYVVRLNPTTGTFTVYPLPIANSSPDAITADPRGVLWFTEMQGLVPRIGLLSAATGAITEYHLPPSPSLVYGGAPGITLGPDGNLWFTENGWTGAIGTMDLATGAVREFPVPTANSEPLYLTTGPGCTVWFTEYDGNRIGRIT